MQESFLSRVLGVRAEELLGLWKAAVISSVNTTIMLTVPVSHVHNIILQDFNIHRANRI